MFTMFTQVCWFQPFIFSNPNQRIKKKFNRRKRKLAAAMFGDAPTSFTAKESIQQRVKSKIIFLLSNHLFLL